MPLSTTINKREYWYAHNISTRTFSLGDLPAIPTFDPNSTYDLLEYYSQATILQSTSLLTAAQNEWVQITKVLDGVSTVIDPAQFQAQLTDAASTSAVNTWSATQTFIPASGPAIVAQGDVHAGDGTHHVDSQGVVRIFGLGAVNEDGSLPTDYELLNVGWDGSSKYQLITEAGGTGVVRNLSLNGAEIDPDGNVEATSFTGDGSGLTNLPIPSVGSPFTLNAHNATEVPLTITLATSQTANALNINSHGNTGGNLFSVDPSGNIRNNGYLVAQSYVYAAGLGDASGVNIASMGSAGMTFAGSMNLELSLFGSGAGYLQIANTYSGGVLRVENLISNHGNLAGFTYQGSPVITFSTLTGNMLIGDAGINVDPSSRLEVSCSDPSVVGLGVKLAAAQTANAVEINSVSGSGGDVFKVDASGNTVTTGYSQSFAAGTVAGIQLVGQAGGTTWNFGVGVPGQGGGEFTLWNNHTGSAYSPILYISQDNASAVSTHLIFAGSGTFGGNLTPGTVSVLPTATGSGNIIQQGGHLWYDRPSDSTWKQLDPP